ncbi:MAG: nucleotidyltransferase [Polyangiaceae bacterium]
MSGASLADLLRAHELPLVHSPSAIPVDMLIAAPGLDEELLDRAVWLDLGGVEVPVISAEDLVALKFLAGRRKDLEDCRGVLLERAARLDLERTRALVRAFADATENPKLPARLERLVRAAARRRSSPRTG